jgi:DNA-binding SARP family transcriptional activator
MASEASRGLRIELLGRFRVTVGARSIPDEAWRRRKPAALIKLLALAPGHRLHREQILDALWPNLDPLAASANLRKALHHARRAIDPLASSPLIASMAGLLSLRAHALTPGRSGYVASARISC